MLTIFLTLFIKTIYICISNNETNPSDCTSWLPEGEENILFYNSTDFSSIQISPNEKVFLGIGNVPDLALDFSTLTTQSSISDNIDLIINLTDPEVNDVCTFDFAPQQFDDLNSLTFNNVKLKPNNNLIVHTTSTTHQYSLIFNDVKFCSGYAFDSDIFRPLSPWDFEDITIIEIEDRWLNDNYLHNPIFGKFLFSTDGTIAMNDTNPDNYLVFDNERLTGKPTIVTEYSENISFILGDEDDIPSKGFEIYSHSKDFFFSGCWNENITLDNDGLQLIYNGSDAVHIYDYTQDKCDSDTFLPMAVSYGRHPLFYSSNYLTYDDLSKNFHSITVNSRSKTLTFTSPWNITGETAFTHINKTSTIVFDHLYFRTTSSSIYRTDIKHKLFQASHVTLADGLSIDYPGKTDIILVGYFDVRPGCTLNLKENMRFDKNLALLRIIWSSSDDFPRINIEDPSIVEKGIPRIVFTDEENETNIANANETYSHIVGKSMPVICGLGINEISKSRITVTSQNPSFDEMGVWDFFWALDNNGEPTGTDNTTQNLCLWFNMTELPEIPVIPLPTATKDPAAVDRTSMISMIVIFIFLFVSGVLGYFTKFLKQNRRDREKEIQDEIDRKNREKEMQQSDSDVDTSDITKSMDMSDLSDNDVEFVQNLSVNSWDEFSSSNEFFASPSVKLESNDNNNEQNNENNNNNNNNAQLLRKNSSFSKKMLDDDVNVPLLNPSDD